MSQLEKIYGGKMSEDYLEQYRILHSEKSDYGTSSLDYLDEACLVIDYLSPKTVLDFGCGKGSLLKELSVRYPKIEFYAYDPAIPGRDVLPIEKVDLIINTDVLEHIPEHQLPEIVEKIASISDNCFFSLHHALAYQILPNGKNAHCTVKPKEWYYNLFCQYFKTPYPLKAGRHEHSVCITFTPTVDFINQYHLIVAKKRAHFLQFQQNEIQHRDAEIQRQQTEIQHRDAKIQRLLERRNRRLLYRAKAVLTKIKKQFKRSERDFRLNVLKPIKLWFKNRLSTSDKSDSATEIIPLPDQESDSPAQSQKKSA